mmetsp:Transcript_53755/g.148538  ORF Transcript_53755/g.148538 Transcript_53755/m.148538 type:complete len:323 (-) Transcript_53755:310-1278(-)
MRPPIPERSSLVSTGNSATRLSDIVPHFRRPRRSSRLRVWPQPTSAAKRSTSSSSRQPANDNVTRGTLELHHDNTRHAAGSASVPPKSTRGARSNACSPVSLSISSSSSVSMSSASCRSCDSFRPLLPFQVLPSAAAPPNNRRSWKRFGSSTIDVLALVWLALAVAVVLAVALVAAAVATSAAGVCDEYSSCWRSWRSCPSTAAAAARASAAAATSVAAFAAASALACTRASASASNLAVAAAASASAAAFDSASAHHTTAASAASTASTATSALVVAALALDSAADLTSAWALDGVALILSDSVPCTNFIFFLLRPSMGLR